MQKNIKYSKVQKCQKNLYRRDNPAALRNAGSVAFTDCTNWTGWVTCSITGAKGVSLSISCKGGIEG